MNSKPHYDILDQFICLKDNYGTLDADTRATLKAQVILNSADPRAIVLAADITGDNWANIYPQTQQPQISTTSAIDIFLESYGHASPEEDALLERLIFNPTPDYSAVLEAKEPQSAPTDNPDLTSSRIDTFMAAHTPTLSETPNHQILDNVDNADKPETIDKNPTTQPNTPPPHTNTNPIPPKNTTISESAPSSLNESLAKIYIKQGRYRRAYEIISDLNLKYPGKSIYFADQLRFLSKLIALSEHTDK